MAAVEKHLVVAARVSSSSSPRPLTKRAPTRATSRDTCPASAKTAANIRMPRSGSVIAFAALGDGEKAGELSRC